MKDLSSSWYPGTMQGTDDNELQEEDIRHAEELRLKREKRRAEERAQYLRRVEKDKEKKR